MNTSQKDPFWIVREFLISCFKTQFNFRLALVLFVISLTGGNLLAQLDTIHYMPPCHGPTNSINTPNEQFIHLSTTRLGAFPVTIKRGDGTVLTTITISRAAPAIYNIGTGTGTQTYVVRDSLSTVLSSRGLIMSAPYAFYANFRVRAGNVNQQAEMISCQGTAALGTTFRAGVAPVGVGTTARSFFVSFMATQNNTTVLVNGYNPNVVFAGPGTSTITSNSLTITLNKGQTYVLCGYSTLDPANLNGFVGASVTSDKPIVMNNGNWTGTIENQSTGQDIMADQAVPVNRLGTEYVCIRGNGTNTMEQPLVIAHSNNTQVFIGGSTVPFVTLNAGQYALIPESNYSGSAHESIYIRTSQPAYLYQPLGGTPNSPNSGMNFIPPVSCLLPTEAMIPDVSDIGTFPYTGDLVLVTRQGSAVTINSVAQTGAQAITGLPGWETYRISAVSGDAYIASTGPMAVGLFGYNGDAGYAGYYSGFNTAIGISWLSGGGVCSPGALGATPGFTLYQWLLNGVPIVGQTTSALPVTVGGNYQVIAYNGTCQDTSAIFFVPNPPTVSNAGPNQNICGLSGTMAGNTPTVGTGNWTQLSGPGTASFTNSTAPVSGVSVSVQGTYTFVWTITSGGCPPSSDQITINFYSPPTVSNAGLDRSVCGLSTNLAGNSPTIGTGTWTQVSGPGTSNFANANASASLVNVTQAGTYSFRWSINNGTCPVSQDAVLITFVASPTTAVAGAAQSVCGLTATLNGNTPVTGSGQWSFVSGPGTTTFTNAASPASGVTASVAGTYVLQWTITNAPCPASSAQVTIQFVASPTVANAGQNQTVCGLTANLSGNTPTTGNGAWTVVSGPGTVSFSNASSPASTAVVSVAGTYVLRWRISNAPCVPSDDQVQIVYVTSPTIVNAGANQTLCGLTDTLAGNTPAVGTGQWTLVSGPGSASFGNASQPGSSVTVTQFGTYVFQWSISVNPCPPISDQVQIIFTSPPSAANAGADQTICGTTTSLTGNTPAIGTGQWAFVSGPGTISFSNVTSPTSAAVASVSGVYVVSWTISNPPCAPVSDQVQLSYTSASIPVNAGINQTVCGLTATLAANTPSSGTGIWSLVSGPGTASFSALNSSTSAVTVTQNGVYILQWSITSPPCAPVTDQVQITFNGAPTTSNAGPNQTVCGLNVTLSGNTPVIGTGQWSVVSGPGSIAFTNPASPTTSAVASVTGTFVLQWTISNTPCLNSADQVQIVFAPQPTTSNAGPNQTVCGTSATLAANTPVTGSGTWSLISGPGTANFTASNSPASSVSVSVSGIYVFAWTISNSPCTPSNDQVQITFRDNPTTANAGPDQTICGLTALLAGNTPLAGTGLWTFVSGPGTISFTNTTSPTASATASVPGTYVLQWRIANNPCPASTDQVQLIFTSTSVVSNAGADQARCGLTATLAGNTPSAGTGTWSQLSGPGTSVFVNSTLPASGVSVSAFGTYVFQWSVSNPPCSPVIDQVQIIFNDNPTTSNAGPNQTICGLSATLAANTPIVGNGIWTVVSGPGTIAFSNNTSPSTSAVASAAGTYVLSWTISNSPCTPSVDNVQLVYGASPTAANAGTNQIVCGLSATLAGNTPAAGSGTWTLVSGPGTASFANASLPASAVTVTVPGIYVFQWSIGLPPCPATTDQVQVEFRSAPTTANAGPNQTVCGLSAVLAGNAPITGTGQWTVISGPGSVAFTNPSSPTSTAVVSTAGTYVLRWTISNPPCANSNNNVQIVFTPGPTTANAGAAQNVCGLTASLSANTPVNGTGLWTLVSGPGTATFTNAASPGSGVSVSANGIYTFSWTISLSPCTPSSSQVTIDFRTAPTTAAAGADQLVCGSSASLNGNAVVSGTGTWSFVSGPGTISFSNINSPTSTAVASVSGAYILQWTISNSPCPSSQDQVQLSYVPSAIVSNAGADQLLCGLTASLSANTPASGTGSWSQISGPGTSTFTNATTPASGVTVSTYGTYVFQWSVTDPPCSPVNDQITVVFNQTPVSNAGNDIVVCGLTAIMNAAAPAYGIGSWVMLSGPGSVGFTDDSLNTTLAIGNAYGTYQLVWQVTNLPCVTAYDTVSVTYVPMPSPSYAGGDQQTCGLSISLAGNPPAIGLGNWTQVGGPGTATFANPSSPSTQVTVTQQGVYLFEWMIRNDPCTPTFDTVQIYFADTPSVAFAGADTSTCGMMFTLAANTPVFGNGQWTLFNGPGTAVFSADSLANSSVTVTAPGTYVFGWTINNLPCTPSIDQVQVTFVPPPSQAFAGADTLVCGLTYSLSANTPPTGTGVWIMLSGPAPVVFSNPASPVSVATVTVPGLYSFIWSVSNAPCPAETDTLFVDFSLCDNDSDGIVDNIDIDDDNDGILDVVELNSALPGGDSDADGTIDSFDNDSDNDGIADVIEAGGIDPDNDGAYGNSPVIDVNLDGLSDLVPLIGLPPLDQDGDGRPNYQDLDSDQDGINDLNESGRTGLDNNSDGVADGPDTDGDGLPDLLDITQGGSLTANPSNTDGDGVADYLDLDSDNDGIHDVTESGNALLDTNSDGSVDGADADSDGIADSVDANDTLFGDPDTTDIPADTDNDALPDFRDLDSDNDGISDVIESNNAAADLNSDGMVDGNDPDNDGILNAADANDAAFGDPDTSDDAPDTDGDGIADYRDLDSDQDGVNDIDEAGFASADVNSDGIADGADADSDGIPDSVDADDVNTGDPDAADTPPDTDGDGIADFRDLDSDQDGINDIVENGNITADLNSDGQTDGADTDQDGIADIADIDDLTFGDADSTDTATDTDGDTYPDYIDIDSDQDGINDLTEAGLDSLDLNSDGLIDGSDTDEDGIADLADANDSLAGDPDLTDNEPDTDGDGVPDFRDLDSDNDGIDDVTESGQGALDVNQDGLVDGADSDGDGAPDASDATDNQHGDPDAGDSVADTDNDNVPDYRDLDSDNDGIDDIIEAGLGGFDTNGDGLIDGADTDGDGIFDLADGQPGSFGDGPGNATVPDTDGDGVPDFNDLDSDDDGIFDLIEGLGGASPLDSNNDGIIDGTDTDGDGIIDSVDGNNGVFGDANSTAPDTDGDGVADYLDLDSDNDGLPDGQFDETPYEDCDIDGIPNWLDANPCELIIPDVITVNGDGINDYLHIDNIEAYRQNKVTIFNRWGSVVFEAEGYNNTGIRWEGKNTNDFSSANGILPEGTYFYVIDVGDASRIYSGYIYLMTND